jgi:predicted metal-dependent RNase
MSAKRKQIMKHNVLKVTLCTVALLASSQVFGIRAALSSAHESIQNKFSSITSNVYHKEISTTDGLINISVTGFAKDSNGNSYKFTENRSVLLFWSW